MESRSGTPEVSLDVNEVDSVLGQEERPTPAVVERPPASPVEPKTAAAAVSPDVREPPSDYPASVSRPASDSRVGSTGGIETEAAAKLREQLKNKSPDVRGAAARALGRLR